MTKEEVKKCTDAYFLKQFDSIANLKRIFDDLVMSMDENWTNYYLCQIRAEYSFRKNFLQMMGHQMPNEEKELWKTLGYSERE